jgi:hypothetical protein
MFDVFRLPLLDARPAWRHVSGGGAYASQEACVAWVRTTITRIPGNTRAFTTRVLARETHPPRTLAAAVVGAGLTVCARRWRRRAQDEEYFGARFGPTPVSYEVFEGVFSILRGVAPLIQQVASSRTTLTPRASAR